MTKGMISVYHYICSKSLTITWIRGIHLSTDSICKSLLYDQILSRGRLLTDKLMLQGFLQSRLMSFRKFYGRYNDLIYNYELLLSHTLSDIFHTNS
jgi:hypothetical protein